MSGSCCLTKAEPPVSHVWTSDETLLIVFYISLLDVWISDKTLLPVFKYNGPDNMFRVLELLVSPGSHALVVAKCKQHKFSPGSLDVLNKGWA